MGRLLGIALAVAAAGIVVVLAVGPGRDKPEPARASAKAGPATGVRHATAPRARVGATVRMRDLAFSPTRVTVRVGEAVRFANDDDVAHAVEEDVGARSGVAPLFGSGRLAPGSAFRYVAQTAGTVPFVCTLHPTVMRGTIVVLRR